MKEAIDKKKILIVSRFFYPENTPRAFRATELAKEFAFQGHKVTVLIPNKSLIHEKYEDKNNILIKNIGEIKWKRFNSGKGKISSLISRISNRCLQLIFEYPDIELFWMVKNALKKEFGYDLLISVAVPYPIHWGVAGSWHKNQKIARTWVADCGDPFMGCKTDSFKKLFYFKYIEKWFMHKADAITIPVETAKHAYYKEFHSKIKVIPQGFKIVPIESEENKKNEILSFAYAGGFIPEIRDPRSFLGYLTQVNKEYKFYIFTNNVSLINGYEKKLGGKLQIKTYLPREELLSFLSTMDFLVNFDNNTGAAVPSKLIDYKIVDKPILNIEKKLDKRTIDEFFNGDYSNSLKIKLDQYRIENVCSKFLALTENK